MLDQVGLFFGAFFDALIGANLFVAGEPFLIAAGYQFYQGSFLGLVAVLTGGFLGDQASFFIGRHFGLPVRRKLVQRHPRLNRTFARCRFLIRRNNRKVLIFARLLEPVAWFVPFLAGIEKVDWRRFTLFSSIGLLLGVGQFVCWGWVLAAGIKRFPLLMQVESFIITHKELMITGGLGVVIIWGGWKYCQGSIG